MATQQQHQQQQHQQRRQRQQQRQRPRRMLFVDALESSEESTKIRNNEVFTHTTPSSSSSTTSTATSTSTATPSAAASAAASASASTSTTTTTTSNNNKVVVRRDDHPLYNIWCDVYDRSMALSVSSPPPPSPLPSPGQQRRRQIDRRRHRDEWFDWIRRQHDDGGGGDGDDDGDPFFPTRTRRYYHTTVHLQEMFGYLHVLTDVVNGNDNDSNNDNENVSNSKNGDTEKSAATNGAANANARSKIGGEGDEDEKEEDEDEKEEDEENGDEDDDDDDSMRILPSILRTSPPSPSSSSSSSSSSGVHGQQQQQQQAEGAILSDDTGSDGTATGADINVVVVDVNVLWIVVLSYSIFFHDVVYDAKSSSNERDSAAVFRKFASGHSCREDEDNDDGDGDGDGDDGGAAATSTIRLLPAVVEMVVTFIHATEKHQLLDPPTIFEVPNEPGDYAAATTTASAAGRNDNYADSDHGHKGKPSIDSPTATSRANVPARVAGVPDGQIDAGTWDVALSLFLDLDMSVLGKSRQAYMGYAGSIRKEYSFVPRRTYCEKRAEVLQSFLTGTATCEGGGGGSVSGKTKPIYLSRIFQDVFEDRARQNLANEIELLQKGIIPCE